MITKKQRFILDDGKDLSIPYYAFCLCIVGYRDGHYPTIEESLDYIQGSNPKETQKTNNIIGIQLSF